MRRVSAPLVLALALVAVWLSCQKADAIPPFARKYGTSCNTCHVMIPKLNSFGEAFRLNGYQIPDVDEAFVKDAPVKLGAEPWKEMFPRSMWPSSIPGMPPIGLRIIMDMEWTEDETSNRRMNFEFPHEFEILTGGRFDDTFGWFGEVEWKQGGGAEIKQAYLVVNDFLSWTGAPDHLFNLRVGLMDLQLLLSHNNPTRVQKNHPLWGNARLSDWRLRDLGGTVRRSDNGFRFQDEQPSVELNGIIAERVYYGFGVATGSGNSRFDADTHKDLYYKLKYKPIGRDFLGRLGSEEVSTDTKPSGGWRDNGILLEQFGYFGAAPAADNADASVASFEHHPKDDFWALGGAIRGTYEDLDVSVGVVYQEHQDPWGVNSTNGTEIWNYFAKAEYMFFPWLMGRVAWEARYAGKPDDMNDVLASSFSSVGYNGDLDTQRVLFGPVFSPRANLRINIEVERYLDFDGAELMDRSDPNRVWLRIDYDF